MPLAVQKQIKRNGKVLHLKDGYVEYEADIEPVLKKISKKFAKYVQDNGIEGNDLLESLAELYHKILNSNIVVGVVLKYENGVEKEEAIYIADYVLKNKVYQMTFDSSFARILASDLGIDEDVVYAA